MTHLTVHEWQSIGVHNGSGPCPNDCFTRAQANALLSATRAHPLANRSGTNILVDRYTALLAQQVVGVIAAPGCSLEILPKLDALASDTDEAIRSRLVAMLDVALGLRLGEGQILAMARQKQTLLDILIRIFADRLLAEVRRGLPRAYEAMADDLRALRGRLDVVRQFTHHAVRPDRLACRFDALVSDIPLLQVMNACVVLLRGHARAFETQRRLDELRYRLAEVRDVPRGALPWAKVRIDRTNARWGSLYQLARLFLRREWQRTDHDAKAGQGITLLFAMNDLFEAYVAALVTRALHGSGMSVHAQGGLRYCLMEEGEGGKARFQTSPDILVKHGGEIRFVIDTKWKLIGRNPEDKKRGVAQGDVYQMMAYARLYRCRELILLYPHHVGLGPMPVQTCYGLMEGDERLRIASLDLLPGQSAIVDQLARLMTRERASSLQES